MKSKPQSTIHFRSSSVVPRLLDGLGYVKSVRLNPRQRGRGLVVEALFSARLSETIPAALTAAPHMALFLMKSRRVNLRAFIRLAATADSRTVRGASRVSG